MKPEREAKARFGAVVPLMMMMMMMLCHSGLPQNRTFEYPTISINKIADEGIHF
jgi:hypothetical protein